VVDGRTLDADVALDQRAGTLVIRIDGKVVDLWVEGSPPDVGVVTRGHRFYAKVESERMRALSVALGPAHGAGDGVVSSPMPGRVLKVLVAVGDRVTPGTALVVVEAMKMENELAAPIGGVVSRVHVAPGDTVEGGARLVEITRENEP
jgi:biotin carboxyl carrier protein